MINNSQFLDLMKSFVNPEYYMNSIKNMPYMDFTQFAESVKKGTKVLTTTNQIATESLQSMIKKNSETLQNNAANMLSSTKDIIASGDLKQIAECQQKCMKSVYEASINNVKELANMASESSMKIFEVINNNISEQVYKANEAKVKA